MAKHEHSVELAGVNLAGRNHVCAFFNTIDEEHRVLGSFYKDGVDRGEKAARIVELTVKSELQDGQLQFSVSDTGVGLPTEKMDQIFSAFFTTKPQGSGMGLSISRSTVESHGGRLWATANDGRGATFHFTLPTHMTETSSQVNLVTLE